MKSAYQIMTILFIMFCLSGCTYTYKEKQHTDQEVLQDYIAWDEFVHDYVKEKKYKIEDYSHEGIDFKTKTLVENESVLIQYLIYISDYKDLQIRLDDSDGIEEFSLILDLDNASDILDRDIEEIYTLATKFRKQVVSLETLKEYLHSAENNDMDTFDTHLDDATQCQYGVKIIQQGERKSFQFELSGTIDMSAID